MSEQVLVSPRNRGFVLDKLRNGQLKTKYQATSTKATPASVCEICGERGTLVQEKFTIHGREYFGWVHLAGTGCRKEAAKKQEAKAAAKKQETKSQKQQPRKKARFSDDQLLDVLKAVGHPATSREISDKLGIADPDVGRGMVRSRMADLINAGKVAVEPGKKQAKRLYGLA